MSTPIPELVARDTLLLRAFALSILARQSPSAILLAHAREASDAAWSLLLQAETCAVPLARALRERSDAGLLPDRVQTLIAHRELVERQRIMMGRWQLGRIDALACEAGLRVCVIKGGVLLGDDRRAVDLGDIDLLVRPEDTHVMCNVLRTLGMEQELAPWESPKHLVSFVGEGLLPVEIHPRVPYGPGMTELQMNDRPLAGYAAIHRWTGSNAVLAILMHSLEHHPHRCGHLRDLVVVADALGDLGAADEAALEARVGDLPAHRAIVDMLRLADAVRRGTAPIDSGRMRAVAAQKYADLLTPRSARFARFFRARPLARYLPSVMPPRARFLLLFARLRGALRTPSWQPRGVRLDSPAARANGGGVTLLWRVMRLILSSIEGIVARGRARRTVAAADRLLDTAS